MKNKYQQFVEETGQILRFASWKRSNKQNNTSLINSNKKINKVIDWEGNQEEREGCGKQLEKYDLILKCGDWMPTEFDRIRVYCDDCKKENSKQ